MSRKNSEVMYTVRRVGVGILLTAAAFGASACSSPELDKAEYWVDQQWTVGSTEHPPEKLAMRVRRDDIRRDVAFAPRSAALAYDERIGLYRFIANSGASRGDRALIAVSPAGNRALAQRRVATIAAILHSRGIAVSRVFAPAAPDVATVSLSRIVALAPDCPEWERLMKDGTLNEYKPKLGCLNASSLAASVHNPRDLVSGRPLGPSDGPTLNLGLQQLREGKFDAKAEPQGTGTAFSTAK